MSLTSVGDHPSAVQSSEDTKEEQTSHIEREIDLSDLREKSIIEDQSLFENTPFYKSVGKFQKQDDNIDDLLRETLNEMEKAYEVDIETVERKPFVKSENDVKKELVQECESLFSSSSFPVAEVYMNLTFEESKCVKSLVNDTQSILRTCVPISLYQARIGIFLGTLSMEDMCSVFAISKKSQNYYHYRTMCSMPFFKDLTTRAQNHLIRHNMQMCFALNNAWYFFGHTANTSIEQEEQTGIITGLGDFIRANAPYALDLPNARYEDFYRAPWAKTPEFEERHHFLLKEIGTSLRGDKHFYT